MVVTIAAGLNNYGLSRKRWTEWRAVLEAAESVVGELAEPTPAAMVHLDLGIVHGEMENYALAAEQMTEAADCARRLGLGDLELAARLHLSHLLERSGQLAESRAVIRQVRTRRMDDATASWMELVLGMIAGKENDPAGQRSAFDRSIDLMVAAGAPRRAMALRYRTIGESLTEAGEYDQAVAAYQEALSGYRDSSDDMNVAVTLDCLGAAYVSSGRFDEAMVVLVEALPLAQEQQQWDCEARIHVALGRRFAALGQAGEAAGAWREALGIYEYHGAAAAEDVRELLAGAVSGATR